MNKQEPKQTTEVSSTQAGEGAEAATQPTRKPFVEPTISLPDSVLDATAFFQGSAALDIAGE